MKKSEVDRKKWHEEVEEKVLSVEFFAI